MFWVFKDDNQASVIEGGEREQPLSFCLRRILLNGNAKLL